MSGSVDGDLMGAVPDADATTLEVDDGSDVDPVEPTVARRSSALLISVAVMGVGGLLFNSVAARVVEPGTLGIQASLFFWVSFANQASTLGLPVLVARLGRHRSSSLQQHLLSRACTLTVASSIAIGLALVPVAIAVMRPEVRDAVGTWGALPGFLVLVAVVAGFSLTLIVEIRMMAIGLGRYVVTRAVLVNIVRCGLLAVPSLRNDAMVLLLLNAGINALTGALCALALTTHRRSRHRTDVLATRPVWSRELRFAVTTWLGTIALVAAQYGFPIIANITLAENAAFYLAWQITAMVFVIPVTIGHAVIAEASRRHDFDSDSAFRRGLTLSLVMCGSIFVLALVAARPVAVLTFGDDYATVGTVLPLLLAAALPWSFVALWLAHLRAVGEARRSVLLGTGYGVVTTVMAIGLSDGTPQTSALVWCVAHVLVGAVAVAAKAHDDRKGRATAQALEPQEMNGGWIP